MRNNTGHEEKSKVRGVRRITLTVMRHLNETLMEMREQTMQIPAVSRGHTNVKFPWQGCA